MGVDLNQNRNSGHNANRTMVRRLSLLVSGLYETATPPQTGPNAGGRQCGIPCISRPRRAAAAKGKRSKSAVGTARAKLLSETLGPEADGGVKFKVIECSLSMISAREQKPGKLSRRKSTDLQK
jgi:hypothetical protein